MFLSFIVPVYNTEAYLDECLRSLIAQDLPADDYEVICINDGSNDSSLEILKQYQREYANIKVVDIQNRGVSNARNVGIDASAGDYIWMVDSDDFILCNTLSDLKRTIMEHAPDILDFGAYTYNERLSETEQTAYAKHELPPTVFANHVYVTRSIFKRAFIEKHGIRFDPDIAYSEDSLFKCECLLQKPDIYLLRKAYYLVRFRKGSAISTVTHSVNEKKLFSWRTAAIRFAAYYQICEPALKPVLADLLMGNLWSVLSMLAKMPSSEAKPYLKTLRQANLFPFHRPKECTLKRSYQTDRNDFWGKLFDAFYINIHTSIGFQAMRLWNNTYAVYQALRG